MLRTALLYLALAVLLACACFLQGGEIRHLVNGLRHARSIPDSPFQLATATRTISSGPLRGDQLLAINGKPINSIIEANAVVQASAPGARLRLTIALPSGRVTETFVPMPSLAERLNASLIAVWLCTRILIPVVAIGLGFAAAAIRVTDPNAWIMLFMLLGFAEVFQDRNWRGPAPDLVMAWAGFWSSLWPGTTAWFGLRFPEPFRWDRKHAWIKFLLIAAGAAAGFIYFGTVMLWAHDINRAQPLRSPAARAHFVWLSSTVAGVTTFFFALASKIRRARADAKRRLKILYFGSAVAFTPMFCVVMYALARGRDAFEGVPWPVTAFTLLVVSIFPLTLAYVVVVERAMDLRFVIRKSVQYAVAKGGLYLVRAAAIIYGFLIINRGVAGSGTQSGAAIQLTAAGVALVFLGRRKTAGIAAQWIDRRFFREAYDAERVLVELAAEAGRFVEIGPLLQKVATRIGHTLHVPDIVILLRQGDTFRTAYTTRPGEPLDIPAGSGIAAALGERREPLRVWFDKPPLWIRSLDARDLQTLDFMRTRLLLPIPAKDGLAGIMSVGPKLSEAPYSDVDIRLTQSVAAQMGLAVENSRLVESLKAEAAARERLNREIEIAREVQERLFPQHMPDAPGADFAGYCRPARGVGGDYYDFFELEGGRTGIAIGDVSGKGIAAALLMASLQASLRGQAASGARDLSGLMKNVNRLVYEASTSNRYATLFYAQYEPASRNLSFVNAGHNPPIVFRGRNVLRLEATGPVIGLLPDCEYEEQTCVLAPGDILIGFTDGISEAQNDRDEEWGEERLIASSERLRCAGAHELIRGVFKAADEFTGPAPQFDDMTMIVVKIAPNSHR